MYFDPIRRSDKEEYVTVIENTHSIIPTNQVRVTAHFTVEVSILPATPMMLHVSDISNRAATLLWSYAPLSGDESADNQTIIVKYTSGSIAEDLTVRGDIRQLQLSLFPGEAYLAQVVAQNEDGTSRSSHLSFLTLAGGNYIYRTCCHMPCLDARTCMYMLCMSHDCIIIVFACQIHNNYYACHVS